MRNKIDNPTRKRTSTEKPKLKITKCASLSKGQDRISSDNNEQKRFSKINYLQGETINNSSFTKRYKSQISKKETSFISAKEKKEKW